MWILLRSMALLPLMTALTGFDYYYHFNDRKEIHRGDIICMLDPDILIRAYNIMHEDSPEENLPMIPPGYLAVAADAGQGRILLQIEDTQVGSVWYWYYSEWAWGVEENTKLGFVADDFYDFINHLKDFEAE